MKNIIDGEIGVSLFIKGDNSPLDGKSLNKPEDVVTEKEIAFGQKVAEAITKLAHERGILNTSFTFSLTTPA